MNVTLTAEHLRDFEKEIAALFLEKRIRAPVHLSGGNEQKLIEIFRQHVEWEDWICTSWRSHFHCLLKGVPPDQLKAAILEGRSISLCFPEHRIISSAIVGGIAPIAVGLALAIKLSKRPHKVVCFLGDMTAESGIVHESVKYAEGYELPLLWVIEDNGLSVKTSTQDAWLVKPWWAETDKNVLSYAYAMSYPHVGLDQWVQF